MRSPETIIKKIRIAHEIGREIVEAFSNPNMISDTVGLIASRLGYMGVGIAFFNQADRVTSIFTEDYGQSHQTTHRLPEVETGGDIVLWALEKGVLSDENGLHLAGMDAIPDAKSYLLVPIKQADQAVGAIYIQSQDIEEFDEYDRLIIDFIASQLTIAHEKSCQLNLDRKKIEYLSLVSDMGRKITGVLTVPELSGMVTDLIHQHFAYSVVALFLCDPVRPVLVLKGLSDPYKEGAMPVFEQPNDQGVLGEVFQRARPYMTNAPCFDHFDRQPFGNKEDTRSELYVPIHVSDRVIGVIVMQNTQEGRLFDEVD